MNSQAGQGTGLRRRDPQSRSDGLFWHLVLAFGSSSRLCLLQLHRSHQKVAPDQMRWPAFYDRFTPERLEFLKGCLERAMLASSSRRSPRGRRSRSRPATSGDRRHRQHPDSSASRSGRELSRRQEHDLSRGGEEGFLFDPTSPWIGTIRAEPLPEHYRRGRRKEVYRQREFN